MPRLSLNTTYQKAINDIQILENYRDDSLTLQPKHQHFIAEVILIRLFSIIEQTLREAALKIACNTPYRNGTFPTLIYPCSSMIDAENQFVNYNRARAVRSKWTKASFFNNSVREIIPQTESIRIQVSNNGSLINEMRKVRNHVAHRNSGTRIDYKDVVRQVFGANLKIQTGAFLTSTKRLSTPKVDEYLIASKIALNDITYG